MTVNISGTLTLREDLSTTARCYHEADDGS